MKIKYNASTPKGRRAWLAWLRNSPLGKKDRSVVDFIAGFNAGKASKHEK
jgi:hypothetical protein|tara:strand:+ start:547 stop:696 length:150 start_codon:yes stop_codon:yes gene_type:complete